MRRLYFMMILLPASLYLSGQSISIEKRSRSSVNSGEFQVNTETEQWMAGQTALIICDMWDKHWCPTANQRVAEIAPYMNQVAGVARDMGILIIHAPSDVTDYYADHPARKKAMNAPKATNLPEEINQWCSWLGDDEKEVYPIDQSDGGCECADCPSGSVWTKQIDAIEIKDQDVISASGVEIWNLMEAQGIENVMIMGVHTNMCVLGRPFGLRNMARYGKNVVLIRDLTDTMYNPKSWPYVSHFEGTDLIIEHIEKYVCPTIDSRVFTGKAPFRFAEDKRKL